MPLDGEYCFAVVNRRIFVSTSLEISGKFVNKKKKSSSNGRFLPYFLSFVFSMDGHACDRLYPYFATSSAMWGLFAWAAPASISE